MFDPAGGLRDESQRRDVELEQLERAVCWLEIVNYLLQPPATSHQPDYNESYVKLRRARAGGQSRDLCFGVEVCR